MLSQRGRDAPSPRLRGEGRGEGLFFEFGQERLENPFKIVNYILVPDVDHAVTEAHSALSRCLSLGLPEC